MKRVSIFGICVAFCLVGAGCTTDTGGVTRDAPADLESVWSLELSKPDSPVFTEPLIDGDQLFVLGDVGEDGGASAVAAFDLATGVKQWQSDPDAVGAWVTTDLVVVKFADGGVQALERDSGLTRFGLETAQSVAVTADGVAVLDKEGQDTELSFIGLDSGEAVWTAPVEANGAAQPSVVAPAAESNAQGSQYNVGRQLRRVQDSPLVYTHTKSQVDESATYVKYSVDDGDDLGDLRLPDQSEFSALGFMTVTDGGNVVTLTQRTECESTYAITGPDLSDVGTFTVRGGRECPDFGFSEQFVDDKIYGLSTDGSPALFDANSGRTVWSAGEEGVPLTFANGVATYGVGDDCEVHAVDVDSGETVWTWNKLTYSCDAVNLHAATSDVLVFGDVTESFGVDPKHGTHIWTAPGAVVDFDDEYLVLQTGILGDEPQSVTVSTHTGN